MATARAVTAKPKRLKAAAVVAPPDAVAPPKPKGIPGGGNYSGRLQTVEPNALLREQAGFGRAGTQSIGEWADLALTSPYVTAGLDFILGPVSDARIDIEADEESPLGKQQKEFLTWALTERFRLASHNDVAARGFLVSGFALFEPRAELVPCPVLGRDAFALAALEQRLPNSLSPNAWLETPEGALRAIQQQGPKGGTAQWTTLELPAEQTLLYSWKRTGNNWAGESQLRSVWYLAGRIMPLLLKLVGVTAQREGAGLPVAFAKDDKAEITAPEREELMTFFANSSFHESSGIVLPVGFDVRWEFSPGADKTFILDLWKSLGLVVLQQLGAQQLVLGTDNTGSRSVGEVHDARALAFVRKVLAFEESVLNGDSGESHTGLVHRLLKWNSLLSADGSAPRVKLTPKRPELDVGTLGTAVSAFKAAGLLTVRLEDENVIREKLSLGPISEEEYAEAKEKAAEVARQMAKPGEVGPEEEDDEEEPKKPLKASAQRGAWQPWRPLRASERNTDFKRIDEYFTKSREEFAAMVRPIVATMLGVAAPAVAAAMADGKVQPAEIASVPLDTSRLKKAIAKYIAGVRDFAHETVRKEFPAKLLMAAAADGDDRDVKEETDDILEAQRDALVRRMENRARAELEREAVDALRTGEGAQSVVERALLRQLDSDAFKADAGVITTKAFNVSRDEAATLLGGIKSVEYSALLDSATCDPCRDMDGAVAEFDSPEHEGMTPPNRDCDGGDKCRCILVFRLEGAE